MNLNNLISIVPTVPPVIDITSDTMNDMKRKELIGKIHKLTGELCEMYDQSNQENRERNKTYREVLKKLEESVSRKDHNVGVLLRVQDRLNELEQKIKKEKKIRSNRIRRFSPDSTAIHKIDLTCDEDTVQNRNNSPFINQPDSTVCDRVLRTSAQGRCDETTLYDEENAVSSSVGHQIVRTPLIKRGTPIVDVDDLYKNFTQNNSYMNDLKNCSASSNVLNSNCEDQVAPNATGVLEESFDDNPVSKIFEMVKQNTCGDKARDYSHSDVDMESPTSVLARSVVSNENRTKEVVTEKVTELLKKLPEEDKVVLKEGVNHIPELVEKKSKTPLPLLQFDSEKVSKTLKHIQNVMSSSPRLSEFLLEHMEPQSNQTRPNELKEVSKSAQMIPQSTTFHETSKISTPPVQKTGDVNCPQPTGISRMPVQPVAKPIFNRPAVQVPENSHISPQPVPRSPAFMNRNPRSEQVTKNTQSLLPKMDPRKPQPVISPANLIRNNFGGTVTNTTRTPQPVSKPTNVPRPLIGPPQTILSQSPKTFTCEQGTKKVMTPEPLMDSKNMALSSRSIPLTVPTIKDPRIHDLRSKFSQEIGVVHKVGDSHKISPSLKQLKTDKRTSAENPVVSINTNVPSLVDLPVPSHLKNTNPRLNQSPSDPRLLTRSTEQVPKKHHNRKPPPPLPPKRNPMYANFQSRRRSSDSGSKSNTSSPEINTQQTSKHSSTHFHSPLADIYSASVPVAKTGLGYGVQRQRIKSFKIPKINKVEENKSLEVKPTEKNDSAQESQTEVSHKLSNQENVEEKLASTAKPNEENKSASHQNVPEVDVTAGVEIGCEPSDEQKRGASSASSASTKCVDALPQRTRPLKNIITKTPIIVLNKPFLKDFYQYCKEKKEKNTPNSTAGIKSKDGQEAEAFEEKSIQRNGEVENPVENALVQEEKSAEMSLSDNSLTRIEKPGAKSAVKNDLLLQAKPFRIVLNDLDLSILKKMRNKQTSHTKVKLSDSQVEEDHDDEDVLQPMAVGKKRGRRKMSRTVNILTSSEESEYEIPSTVPPVKEFKKKAILSSSDECDSVVNITKNDESSECAALAEPVGKSELKATPSLPVQLPSNDTTQSTLSKTPINTSVMVDMLSCIDNCSCASDIFQCISQNENHERLSTESDVSEAINSSSTETLPSSSDEVSPASDTVNNSSEKPVAERVEQIVSPDGTVSIQSENIEAAVPETKQNDSERDASKKLLNDLKSCQELEELREKLNSVDINDPNWFVVLVRTLPSKILEIVLRVVRLDNTRVGESRTVSEESIPVNQEGNDEGKSVVEECKSKSSCSKNDAAEDEFAKSTIQLPTNKARKRGRPARKVKTATTTKPVKTLVKSVHRVKDATVEEPFKSEVKPARRRTNELDRLHGDIKKMKKTKNNIFTAIGERKCRKQPVSYQERLTRPSTTSQTVSSDMTSSSEDFELPSDTDSLLTENSPESRFSVTSDFISDDHSNSSRLTRTKTSQPSRIVKTTTRRRGRPFKRKVEPQELGNSGNSEDEIPVKYKPGPKSMKRRLYGEEVFRDEVRKQLYVCLPVLSMVPNALAESKNAEEDMGKSDESVEKVVENAALEGDRKNFSHNENVVENTASADDGVEQSLVNLEKTINLDYTPPDEKKRKRKKKKQKKAKRDEQHLQKVMKEWENATTSLSLLHSTSERRKSSSHSVPPVEDKENEPPVEETTLSKDSQDQHILRKIANLPECNAFKGTSTCAQILCIAIDCQESKLRYKCVGPECSYESTDAKMFAEHVSFLHKGVVWNGDCPICFETIVGQTDLIDALSHLMNQHLMKSPAEVIVSDDEVESPKPGEENVVGKSPEQESTNACETDVIVINHDDEETVSAIPTHSVTEKVDQSAELAVSTINDDFNKNDTNVKEPQPPRLRVRRLSGDLLSGVISATSPAEAPTESATANNEGVLGLSLVIKEVKTKQSQRTLPVDKIPKQVSDPPEAVTVCEFNGQQENKNCGASKLFEAMLGSNVSLNKSSYSEISIMKLYKCGGTTWDNPETCKFSSDVSSDFYLHLKRCHVNNKKAKVVAKKFLKCIYCSEQSEDAEGVVQHIGNVHRICQFQCPYCEYRACRPVYLKWHKELNHKLCEEKILVPELKDNKTDVLERSQSSLWLKPYAEVVLPFCCTHSCEYSTFSEPEFILHSKSQHREVAHWKCSFCDHVSLGLIKLMAHYKGLHSMAAYQCKYCRFGASTSQAMTIHLTKNHAHLYPSILQRKASSSESDTWSSRIVDCDLDEELPKFKSCLKLVKTSLFDSMLSSSSTVNFKPAVTSSSIAKGMGTRVSANSSIGNDVPPVTPDRSESRRGSSGGAISLCSSDDDISDRLVIIEDDAEDSNSTIAERLRQTRRCSAEAQPQATTRTRISKDIVKGLEGCALYKCGMAGCTVAVDDYKSYEEHLRVCDNARNSPSYECPHCDYKVQSPQYFLNHLSLHGPPRYFCTLCDFKHQHSRKVIEHMKSSIHRVHGEAEIVPMIPLKNDKHKDRFIVKFDSDKIVPSKRMKATTEITKFVPMFQPAPKSFSLEQTNHITSVNSWEEVEKFLPMQTFREFVVCNICQYKNKVRSNLLNHMRSHACGGLTTSQDIVNPVPRIGKNQTDLMFNKMSNHAGFISKNDDKGILKAKDENLDAEDRQETALIPEFVPKIRRYVCNAPGCKYLSQDVCGLKSHYNNLHKDLTEFKCPHCKKTGATLKLNIHLRYHGDKLYKCGYCDYVHYQRHGIEKHQQDHHQNLTYDIVVVRELSTMESDQLDNELRSNFDNAGHSSKTLINEMPKRGWKCNLCGERWSTELLVKTHCQTKHSISYKYKCCLCDFGTFQNGDIGDHVRSMHDGLSQTFLLIYTEVNENAGASASEVHRIKSNKPTKFSTVYGSRTLSNVAEKELNATNVTPPASTSASGCEASRDVGAAMNVDESNEMVVDPYPDNAFRCPFCSTFRTKSLQEMRYHLYKEKGYDRYVCTICATFGVSRAELEPHITTDRKNHPLESESYIRKLTADDVLELRVKQALRYQYMKIHPDSPTESLLIPDSDNENVSTTESQSQLTNLGAAETKNKQIDKITSPTKRSKKQTTQVLPTKAFVCSMCPKYFSTQIGLKIHKNSHKKKDDGLPSPKKRANEDRLASNDVLTTKTRTSPESGFGEKRARLSSSVENDPRVLLACDQCPDKNVFFNTDELLEHQRETHQPYPCLRCDKTFDGEIKLMEHLRTSFGVHEGKEPSIECFKSDRRKVKMACPLCTFKLPGVSSNHYALLVRHMKNSHQSPQKSVVNVEVDNYLPRPVTEVEIAYLQTAEALTAPSVQKTPIKRRNVAVKSTARPCPPSNEPQSKFIYDSAVTTIPVIPSPLSAIATAANNETLEVPMTSTDTGKSDLDISANYRPEQRENLERTSALPSVEIIILDDDSPQPVSDD